MVIEINECAKRIKMKKLTIILTLILFVAGCTHKQDGKKKIGVMFSNLSEQRFQNENSIMERFIKARQGEYFLKNAENNPVAQEKQFDELLREGINVLIISVVNNTVGKSIIKKASEHGITTIMYDGFIGSEFLNYCVRFSDKEVGRMMANYALKNVPEGNYMILGGDGRNENAPLIRSGEMEILGPSISSSKINVVYNNYIEEWNAELVYMEVKEYFKLSSQEKVDVIILSSDNMATGAIKALEEIKPSKWPLITGQDGSLIACQNIIQDKQAMSVLKDSKKIAEQTALMALQCAEGKTPETNGVTLTKGKEGEIEIPSYFIDLEVVDKSTINELIKRGIHSKESLGL
jgi:D-xylose transport system substrate-binding protein